MFKEDVKLPNLNELIGEKILMCKKDIKCDGGTLEKGSLVYPWIYPEDINSENLKVVRLSDISQCYGQTSISFESEYRVKERIDINNYAEYFEVNQEATAYYTEFDKEQTELYNQETKYEIRMGKCVCMFFVSLLILVVLFLADEDWGIHIPLSIPISTSIMAVSIILAIIFSRIKKHIKKEADEISKDRLTYLSMIASDSEYSANCDEEMKRLKEKLTALAYSAAIDMNYEEKVKCPINQNESRFQGNKTEE